MRDFMSDVDGASPAKGTVVVFWLEQSHFLFKTSGGTLVHVDPFLSRVVHPEGHIHPEPLVRPEEAKADFVFLTHDHRDHTDPHTVGPMAESNPDCLFVGPPESRLRCQEQGVRETRLVEVRPGDRREFDGFSVCAVYAENTSAHDATTHLGYVFEFDDCVVYHSGDTRRDPDEYLDRIGAVKGLRPDAMIVAINEGYNNPGPEGAARLVEWVDPRLVIPCHFDCFKGNTIDPQRFVDVLLPERREAVRILPRGGSLTVSHTEA